MTIEEKLNETQKYYNILVEREQKILDTLANVDKSKESSTVYEAMKSLQAQELYITRLAKDQLEDLINAEFGGYMVETMRSNGNMLKKYQKSIKELEKLL